MKSQHLLSKVRKYVGCAYYSVFVIKICPLSYKYNVIHNNHAF